MTFTELSLSIIILLICLYIVFSNRKKNELKVCNEEYARTQKELLNKIKEFDIFIDAIPGYVWQKNKNGAIVNANLETCAALEISKLDILGKNVRDLFPPELAHKLAAQDEQLLSGKITTLQTEDFSPFFNNKKFISTRMDVIKNEDDEITGIIGIGLDVTKLKIIEEELHCSKNYLKFILDMSINFVNISLSEIDEAITEALAQAGNFSMADRAFLLSYNADTRTIWCTHEWIGPEVSPPLQRVKNLLSARSLHWTETHLSKEHMSTLCIQELPEDDTLKQILIDLRIKSIITSPLLHASRCLGFVGLASTYSDLSPAIHTISTT
jgi:PAS domain S-box-containing protein